MLTDTAMRSLEETTSLAVLDYILMVKKNFTLYPKNTLNRFKSKIVPSFDCLIIYFSEQSLVFRPERSLETSCEKIQCYQMTYSMNYPLHIPFNLAAGTQ